MRQLDTLRDITYLFPVFLGLRLVPAGLWFLAVAIPGLGGFPSAFHLVLLLLAAAAVWWIDRWYRARYGIVQPAKLRLGRSWALMLGLAAAWLALRLGAAAVGLRPVVIILAVILFVTAVLFALPRAFPGGRLATAFLLIAAALCAVLMIVLTRDPASLGATGAVFSLAVGLMLCLAGAIEHGLLARAFTRLGEKRDA